MRCWTPRRATCARRSSASWTGTSAQYGFAVTREERLRLVDEMVHDVTGFGPLEPLLADPTITEVMVNGPNHIYIERDGKIERIDIVFLNDQHVLRVIERIITPLGRRIDEIEPARRCPPARRLARQRDHRAAVAHRPGDHRPQVLARRRTRSTTSSASGPRRPRCSSSSAPASRRGSTSSSPAGPARARPRPSTSCRRSSPNDERIVTIEDAAELQLRQDHVITLEARPPNLEGEGEITIRNLLRNAMHMRPDRIIVGECRAGEALDMLQAMTTGHDGSLSTGHANTPEGHAPPPRDDGPDDRLRDAAAGDPRADRLGRRRHRPHGPPQGRQRKIVNITEVYGIEDDEILTQDIFTFVQTGYRDGKIEGSLQPTGIRPTFMSQFQRAGVELPPGEFGIPPEDPDEPDPAAEEPVRGAARRRRSSPRPCPIGDGRTVVAGGMVYISSIGPVDRETGQVVIGVDQGADPPVHGQPQRAPRGAGSSLEKVVWANWSLQDPTDFDEFNEEWNRWFPGDAPIGQLTLMPPLQRRAGFGVSLGVIAKQQ